MGGQGGPGGGGRGGGLSVRREELRGDPYQWTVLSVRVRLTWFWQDARAAPRSSDEDARGRVRPRRPGLPQEAPRTPGPAQTSVFSSFLLFTRHLFIASSSILA